MGEHRAVDQYNSKLDRSMTAISDILDFILLMLVLIASAILMVVWLTLWLVMMPVQPFLRTWRK